MIDTIISLLAASGFNSQPNYSLTWEQLYEHKASNRIKKEWCNSTIEILNGLIAELKLNSELYKQQCDENNISIEAFMYILSSTVDKLVAEHNLKTIDNDLDS